ncbi:MAG: ribosome maturation factor RimM [Chitinophagaceae bacterium]|jgi:16S rRNA processing protein RimM|nr:ribosome maturation factor RimM [Chitinophagaceae bacterium]MCU0404801.1 ribosome maturation factor RimM [Chitinophagaceae bacterium]
MEKTIGIGRLVATFGLKGELVLQHALGGKSELNGVKAVFVEMQRGNPLPFFLESSKPKSTDETWIKLEGIHSKEEASRLLQKQVWVLESDFNRLVKPNAVIAIIGYEIVENGKVLGTIAEIIEQPHQVICTIFIQEKEVLIPLNESTLEKIDRRKKQVFVSLPDGLLDIYLH